MFVRYIYWIYLLLTELPTPNQLDDICNDETMKSAPHTYQQLSAHQFNRKCHKSITCSHFPFASTQLRCYIFHSHFFFLSIFPIFFARFFFCCLTSEPNSQPGLAFTNNGSKAINAMVTMQKTFGHSIALVGPTSGGSSPSHLRLPPSSGWCKTMYKKPYVKTAWQKRAQTTAHPEGIPFFRCPLCVLCCHGSTQLPFSTKQKNNFPKMDKGTGRGRATCAPQIWAWLNLENYAYPCVGMGMVARVCVCVCCGWVCSIKTKRTLLDWAKWSKRSARNYIFVSWMLKICKLKWKTLFCNAIFILFLVLAPFHSSSTPRIE